MTYETFDGWDPCPDNEQQATLVELHHVSPTYAVLRLREWNRERGSSTEVMPHGDSASSDAKGV